ncbi:MAG: hypothetical protein U0R50_07380 [Gaiellales bacterium]
MEKPSRTSGLGSLATAAITGVSLVFQSALAVVVGVILAREFGRNAETDGFFAAYGVFIVLALAANAIRLVVLPPLARARAENRLAQETSAWATVLAAGLAPLLVLVLVLRRPIADFLTGDGPDLSLETAAHVLPIVVVAGVGQIYAGLLASALAALDDYITSAVAFIVSSAAGLIAILLLLDRDGVEAVATGMVVNGLGATAVMATMLFGRARRASMPASGVRPSGWTLAARVVQAVRGCALPLALQGSYLMCLPLAPHEGVGAVTSFGYAFLGGSAIIAATAASFGLVTAVPLTRAGVDSGRVAHHVVATSWLAVLAVGAVAGITAVAGEPIMSRVLGAEFYGAAGAELGQLIAYFAPWMVVSIGVTVTFPLMFVAGRERLLPLVAVGMLVIQAPLAFTGQRLFGLPGLALALAGSTAFTLAALLYELGALRATVRGLAVPAVFVTATATPLFVLASALLPELAAAALGLAAYLAVAFLFHPPGLIDALRYLHALK